MNKFTLSSKQQPTFLNVVARGLSFRVISFKLDNNLSKSILIFLDFSKLTTKVKAGPSQVDISANVVNMAVA